MDLIDLGASPYSDGVFEDFLRQVCERLELDHAAYAGINPVSQTIHGFVTYPEAWKKHYAEKGFDRIDPTLEFAARSIAPVDWQRLATHPNFERVFSDAEDFGIGRMGMTIPVRGPYGDIGMLSVSARVGPERWKLQSEKVAADLQSVAVHLHDTVMRSDDLSRVLRHPQLSKRELEILQWTAAGKTQHDIGEILSISHRTVEVHLKSSREKLYALTTAQAVARAIALRLIYPL
ncbi:MAG: autoinducer binding domain-containing protein [Sphingomonadales bacterium]|nr:autoinducer binding domain-containing protein [Sphingomonadales bacterium]